MIAVGRALSNQRSANQHSAFSVQPLIHRKGREERKGKTLNKILVAFAKTACFREGQFRRRFSQMGADRLGKKKNSAGPELIFVEQIRFVVLVLYAARISGHPSSHHTTARRE
jgi:hypothetical protein